MDKRKYNSIGKYVSEIYRCGNKFFSKAYAKYNIGSGQFMFLRVLYDNVGLTQEDLSSILNIDKATTARALKKLEDEGYVYREKSLDDKRANIIGVTQKALDIRKEFFQVLSEWESIVTSPLTDEERDVVIKLLEKIALNEVLRRE